MKRYLIALLLTTGLVSCAAPVPITSTATPAPTHAAPGATSAATATHQPTSTATPSIPLAPPLREGADSALFMDYYMGRYELHRIDLATGQPASGMEPLNVGHNVVYGLSPDGGQMALFNYPKDSSPEGGVFELIDTQTLQSRTLTGVSIPQIVLGMTFSPDSRFVTVSYYVTETGSMDSPLTGYGLALVDLEKGMVSSQIDLDFSPDTVHFSPDGRSIVLFGVRYGTVDEPATGTPQVRLLGSTDLRVLWSGQVDGLLDGWYPGEGTQPPQSYEGYQWSPAAVFSPDSSKLYIVHADVDRLTTVDFTQKSVVTVDIAPQLSFLDRLMGFGAGVAYAKAIRGATLNGVLSSDGQSLVVVGVRMDFTTDANNQIDTTTSTPVGLRIIDVASGVLLKQVDSQATGLGRSGEGGQIFLYSYDTAGSPTTEILDGASFAPSMKVPGWQVYATGLTLSDGRRAYPAIRWGGYSGATLGLIDGGTFRQISSWEADNSWGWVVPPS